MAQGSKITDTHPQHQEFSGQWEKIRDVLGGADKMRAASSKYFPMSSAHNRRPMLYAQYVDRAMFAGMTGRTLDALIGSIFRKPPVVDVPKQYELRLYSIDGRGTDINTFAKVIAKKVLSYGRVGLLADIADKPDPADPISRLPKLIAYDAVDICNWRTSYMAGEEILTQLVLRDSEVVEAEFGAVVQPAYMVMELIGGQYVARRFTKVDGEYVETARYTPSDTLGRPLSKIPFIFVNSGDLNADVSPSPLAPLADCDVAWFRSSADYEAALHKLAFPIPVLIGVDDAQTTWEMGPDTVWLLPVDADAKMLEFSGQGLQPLADSLSQKERTASMLGARLLAAPKMAAETAQSVRLQHSSETATISSVAHTVGAGISKALGYATAWVGIEGETSVTLNQDFLDEALASDQLRELRETAQAGLLPFDDFVLALQRGEVIRSNLTVEEVRSLLETDPVPTAAAPLRLVEEPVAPAQADEAAE